MKKSSREVSLCAFATAILLGTQPEPPHRILFKVAHTNAPGEIQDQGVLQFRRRLE